MRYKYEGDIATKPAGKVYRPDGQGKLTCYEEDGVTVSWTYEGDFVNGQMTGQGRTTQIDSPDAPGYIYEGAHVNGWADGYGIWYRLDGTMMYEGNFKAHKYDGQGTSFRPDGTKEYEGQWEEDLWKGVGTLYRPDGTISRNGTWMNGGSEEYERQEGQEKYWYEGDWDKDG